MASYSNQKTRIGPVNGKATEIGFWSSSRSTSVCLAQSRKEAHKNGGHLPGRDVSSQLSCPGLSYTVVFFCGPVDDRTARSVSVAAALLIWHAVTRDGTLKMVSQYSVQRPANLGRPTARSDGWGHQIAVVNSVCQDIAQFCMSSHCRVCVGKVFEDLCCLTCWCLSVLVSIFGVKFQCLLCILPDSPTHVITLVRYSDSAFHITTSHFYSHFYVCTLLDSPFHITTSWHQWMSSKVHSS